MDIILTALDEYITSRRNFNSNFFDLESDSIEIKIANRILIISLRNQKVIKKEKHKVLKPDI